MSRIQWDDYNLYRMSNVGYVNSNKAFEITSMDCGFQAFMFCNFSSNKGFNKQMAIVVSGSDDVDVLDRFKTEEIAKQMCEKTLEEWNF